MPIAEQQIGPRFLTVDEVAVLLRVKPRTIHYWVSERRIPFRKAGRFTLFDRDEIIDWTRAGVKKDSNLKPFSR
jgi:excisionase family DNA binding protein